MKEVIPDDQGYVLALVDVADEADRAFLRTQLRAFNDRTSPHHQAIRDSGPVPLDLTVRDAAGTIVGGLIASTFWGWLEVDLLWIHESLRGHGYGKRLLLLAEEAARQRGVTHVSLTTFSFQARGFYEKLGYRVVGQLDDFPPGGAFYWLRKDFTESV